MDYRIKLSIAAVFLAWCSVCFFSAPAHFPVPLSYELQSGETVSLAARDFSDLQIIRSPFVFKSFVYLFSFGSMKITEGDYTFSVRQNVFVIAWRMTQGDFDTKAVKITIPEGLNDQQIADIYAKHLPSFSTSTFMTLVASDTIEGYLFPSTYFLMPDTTENEVINTMNATFQRQIQTVLPAITSFGQSESNVIKMASILEKEAGNDTDRKIIAGILWKRLTLGMPLEVDSAPTTYTSRGLPQTPIANPGLASITDAINPTKTPYLYFLSDSKGIMHYATTLAGQDANKIKYLDK